MGGSTDCSTEKSGTEYHGVTLNVCDEIDDAEGEGTMVTCPQRGVIAMHDFMTTDCSDDGELAGRYEYNVCQDDTDDVEEEGDEPTERSVVVTWVDTDPST